VGRAVTAPQDALGRPLNPDTGLPYPSASQAQLELVDELLAPLLAAGDVFYTTAGQNAVRDALVEAVVRQHGRTLRDIRAELNGQAHAFEDDARTLAEDALASEEAITPDRAASIAKLTTAARTLRTVVLGGWRS
jgi:hypothetical protein